MRQGATAALAMLALWLTGCGAAEPALTICEAATRPIGSDVRISASYKDGEVSEATFGMGGGFCGDAPHADVNPLVSVRAASGERLDEMLQPGDVAVVTGTLSEVVEVAPGVPWLTLTDGRIEG